MGYWGQKPVQHFFILNLVNKLLLQTKFSRPTETDEIKGSPKLLFDNVSEKHVLTNSDKVLS